MAEKEHRNCLKALSDAQQVEYDNRQMVRESDHFLNKRDGQWEPEIITKFLGKPRYTFDECNPIVDDIMGEMETMDFGIRVHPAGGTASKDIARIYEGLIRTIENISQARFIYNACARIMVGTGFSAWRVVTDYRDSDSFQQDLMIRDIPNAEDSVWFDQNAVKPDMSDAGEAWVLTSMSREKYEEKYPDGSGLSIGSNIQQQVYSHKKTHEVVMGEYYYQKEKMRELVLMTDGSVYVVNEDFNRIKDDLFRSGIKVNRTRKRNSLVVYRHLFDGGDWLKDSEKTVFEYIPVIPVYGNFRISENKVIYWGVVEKIMDAQRVINYAESRKIEEGALSPRGKHWLTKDQAISTDVRNTLRTLNTNSDPVQFYDHAPDQPPPIYQGAPQSNPGLVETAASAQNFVQRTSGTFDESRGTAPSHRSGLAIDKLQMKSDNPKRKWFTAMEIALAHTCRILVKAAPKVYDTQQVLMLTEPDGNTNEVTIRQKVLDEESGKVIELNNISQGQYNITCTAGPAFHSRQQEAVTAINEISAVDPTVMQLGGDVLLNNINAPGIDKIAERKRAQMVQAGLIPPSQQTDEEKKIIAAQQKAKEKGSPIDQANLLIAQAQVQETQGKNQEREIKLGIEQQKVQLKAMELQLKKDSSDKKQMLDMMQMLTDQVKTQAETLKLIKDAMGVDALVSPESMRAYNLQSQELSESIRTQ